MKLQTTRMFSVSLADLRMKLSMLCWESLPSIHSKPAGSQSSSWSALLPIGAVQVGNPALQLPVRVELEQVPVQARPHASIPPLAEFAAHEQQFLAGLRVHVGVQQAAGSRISARGRRASCPIAILCRARLRRARAAGRSFRGRRRSSGTSVHCGETSGGRDRGS